MVFGFVFCSWISAEEDHKTSKEVDEGWLNFYSKHGEKKSCIWVKKWMLCYQLCINTAELQGVAFQQES